MTRALIASLFVSGCCLALCSGGSVSAASKPPIDLRAFRNLVSLSDPRIAPDGRSIAFVKSVPDFAADTHVTAVDVVRVAGGAPRALTSGAQQVSSPRWSPNGSRIAYLSEGTNHQDQVFVVSASGGAPRQLTSAHNGVEQFSWSPDGAQIAFVTPDDEPSAAAIAHHDNLFSIHDDGFLTDAAPTPSHIWLIAGSGGVARRLTHGSWSVLENAPPFAGAPSDPVWSRNGSTIVFTKQADDDDSDTDRTTIAAVNVHTGAVRDLTSHRTYEYQPAFSPSGTVAYLYPHGPGPLSVMNVFAASSSAGTNLTPAIDRDVSAFAWTRNGSLLLMANQGIGTYLWLKARNGPARRLDLHGLYPTAFDASNNGPIAVVADNATTAAELYVLASPTAAPRRLTNYNAPFANYRYGRSVEVTWTASDGQRSDGVLTYPVGYDPARRYKLVLYLHGGPELAANAHFWSVDIGPMRHALAGAGYVIFEPNYRGSDNLGNAHEHAIYRDPGVGPARDVLAGLRAVERRVHVDPSYVYIAGHSYGGYMTAWMISHYHFWRRAIVADGMVDWTQEYELSADGNLAWARDSLGGSPWDAQSAALYKSGSPITYAGHITTPTLIISGTADETVPISESYALYHALASRGVPVQFVGIPGAHHSPSDPVRIERYYALQLDWLRK